METLPQSSEYRGTSWLQTKWGPLIGAALGKRHHVLRRPHTVEKPVLCHLELCIGIHVN